MSHVEMPRSTRVVAAVLGVLFLVLGAVIVVESGAGDWKPMLGAALVAGLGLDLVVGAARGEWPIIAPLLFLP